MTVSRLIQTTALVAALNSVIVLLATRPWPLVSWLVSLGLIGALVVRFLARRARS